MLNKKEMKSKIAVGHATVWLILMVSLAATLAYWYVLSGIESAGELSQFWQLIIWLVVGVGLVAEIIKKVTLSTFRNKNIWLTATFVSVVTVMGTYSILDQTRQNDLTKQSDSYKDSRAAKLNADTLVSQYAFASGYDLEALEKQLDKVIVDRDDRKIKYNTYLKRKAELEKKISSNRAYKSAVATSGVAQTNMANGNATGSSANPLLSNIAGALNGSEELIKTIFYLLVTILLEVAAFWIGGQVETMRRQLHLTEAELLDMKNQELFGFSMRDLQRELFDRVNRSQQDAIEAEHEVQQIRKNRKDKDTGENLSSGAVASSVNEKRETADDNQVKAKRQSGGSEYQNEGVNDSPAIGFQLPKSTKSSRKKTSEKLLTSERQNELDLGAESDAESDRGKTSLSGLQNAGSVTVSGKSVTASSEESTESDNRNESESDKKGLAESDAESEKGKMIVEVSTIYQLWRKAMVDGSCKNTITGGRKWIRSGKKTGLLTVSKTNDAYVSAVLNALYEMAVSDGWMERNPEWKQGKKVTKYLFV